MKKTLFAILATTAIAASTPALADLGDTSSAAELQKEQAVLSKLNINMASQDQLTELPGIGEKKAAAIVDYRMDHGNFNSVEELTNVKGIGDKLLTKLRDKVKV